jgi:hypothetical protein
MIVIRLIGGLGNQCFQYAVGRHLSEIHHSELKIDISEFETYKLHAYSLNNFNIIENFATAEDVAELKHVRENHFHFDSEILHLPNGIYLHGYWASEKYFANIADIIRRELTVKSPLSGRDKEIAEQITSCESVSVHIRRLDYLPNTYTEQILEACSLDYYLYSIESIARNAKKSHFFVFSDDIEWSRGNFKLPHQITFVGHNGPDKNYEDMRLMSLCKHNIIANSTFSWWGAWLNKYPDKMVFAPKKWFTEKARNSPRDLIPDLWIKV